MGCFGKVPKCLKTSKQHPTSKPQDFIQKNNVAFFYSKKKTQVVFGSIKKQYKQTKHQCFSPFCQQRQASSASWPCPRWSAACSASSGYRPWASRCSGASARSRRGWMENAGKIAGKCWKKTGKTQNKLVICQFARFSDCSILWFPFQVQDAYVLFSMATGAAPLPRPKALQLPKALVTDAERLRIGEVLWRGYVGSIPPNDEENMKHMEKQPKN